VIEPRSRGVLDTRFRGYDDQWMTQHRVSIAHTTPFPMRLKTKFACPIKLILPVQSSLKKYSGFRPTQISSTSVPVPFL
jgi:hypothetical protein